MAYNSSLMTDEPLTSDRLRHLIQQVEELFADGVICWTAGTHDFPRLKSRWSKYQPSDAFLHDAFDHMFAALIISLKGSCCIYQGDELGLTQADIPYEKMQDPFGIQGYPKVLGRDGSRTPMPWLKEAPNAGFTDATEPWLPVPPEHQAQAVDVQEADPNSLLNKYRQLIQWRKQQPALKHGSLKLLQFDDDRLVGFLRQSDKQQLLCLFNLSPETVYHDLSDLSPCQPIVAGGFSDRSYHDMLELVPFGVFFANLQPTQASA
jgi:alpha-glucosidase